LSTIFFSEGISMYKCSLFYYNTFNCKQYSYGLTSYQLFFFFWFRRLFNRTLLFFAIWSFDRTWLALKISYVWAEIMVDFFSINLCHKYFVV
jgi:hypothetical protein